MIDLKLSFRPDRTEEGVTVYRLDPSIDLFGQYQDNKCDVGPSRHGVRMHVQREIELEENRRNRVQQNTQVSTERQEAPEKPKKLVNVDFFGRPVESSVPDGARPSQEAQQKALRVFYRYHEGYSNAVRKGIKLRDLM